MSDFAQALADLKRHEGVEHVLVLGSDGLLIQHLGDTPLDADTAAAMVPGIAAHAGHFGAATARGDFRTAVVEYQQGVGIVLGLSADVVLALVLRAGAGFAPLLHTLRAERARLAALV